VALALPPCRFAHFSGLAISVGASSHSRRAIGTVKDIDRKNWETMKFTIARTVDSHDPRNLQLLDRVASNLLVTQRPSIMAVI
jgi:hypothetical protein